MSVQKQTVVNNGEARVKADPVEPPPEPIPTNTLPDNGDGQNNLMTLEVQREGLSIDIKLWPNAAEFPFETDTVFLYVDGRLSDFRLYDGPITDDPVKITFKSAQFHTHGEKEVVYSVKLSGTSNEAFSHPLMVMVDTIDPNQNNKPGTIRLPADLPGNSITPEYLNAHNNSITLTIPNPSDRRIGDTWQLYWGESETPTLEDNVPDVGPITVVVADTTIYALGEGDKIITYYLKDRAGNLTQVSLPTTVNVQLNNPPTGLQPPDVLAMPPIDKVMARQGVLVQIPSFTGFRTNDELFCYWQGKQIGYHRFGATANFPLEFTADFDTIAAPGTEYDAEVTYLVRRNTIDYRPPLSTFVEVYLTVPGEDQPGPGPVDPNLEKPLVKGTTGLDNVLLPDDRGEDATATFTIYTGREGGQRIDLYYGLYPGKFADSYPVQGNEDDDFEVSLNIPWDLIEEYGNGDIACYYKVFNAVNYKESDPQLVSVRIFELEGLEEPTFEKLDPEYGVIMCKQEPWLGVPIRIHSPDALQMDDEVTLHAVRYNFFPVDVVVGSEIELGPYQVSENEAREGFTRVMMLPYFALYSETRGRGYVGMRWSIYRPSTGDRGSSEEQRMQWDVRYANQAGTCVPNSTRASKSRAGKKV